MPSIAAMLRRVPAAARFRRLLARLQYNAILRFARRRNYLYTQFCRLPTQLTVLAGPVLDAVALRPVGGDIRLIVFGCSIGAEAYSIASTLRSLRPDVGFHLECFDIEPTVIERARAACYTKAEVTLNANLPSEFIAQTFYETDDGLRVKPEIAASVSFAVGDVLDVGLIERLSPADIVVAQNFLYHLARPDAVRAFRNLFRLLRPRGAFLVDGADLDLRATLTLEAGLSPCPAEFERIHSEARVERGYAWPATYWGLEPFDSSRPDALRRYATIFLRHA